MKNIKAVRRIRSRVSGTASRPRLCVSVSLNHLRAQLIDDTSSKTLVSLSTESEKSLDKKSLTDKAIWLGEHIATLAKNEKIEKVVFDRGGQI